MGVIVASLAILFTFLCIVLTYFIFGMVQFVGAGEGFWSVWVVQLDILFGAISLFAWGWTLAKTIEKKKESRN